MWVGLYLECPGEEDRVMCVISLPIGSHTFSGMPGFQPLL